MFKLGFETFDLIRSNQRELRELRAFCDEFGEDLAKNEMSISGFMFCKI